MARIKLDDPPKKIWNLNQLRISDCFVGIPHAEYYKNNKNHQFIRLMLDAGYSTLHIYFLVFDFPEQKILNQKYHNSFELVRFYREVTGEGIDEGIQQVHNINWEEIIEFLNSLLVVKIQVVSKDMSGFKNIKIVGYSDSQLVDYIGFGKYLL